MRKRRVASEMERLAAAQRVHDRVHARLSEARRQELKRASHNGLSAEQIAEVTGLSVDSVVRVLQR
jgi:DNA-directed RNA polymerase specialized sigma24 family protein